MSSTPTPPEAASAVDPGPPPPVPPGMPTRTERFFSWVRGFGIVRIDGWLGGVCAGIAARLRIDPIIVRGVVVVAAVVGLPMFLLYAIAWALLPGLDRRIHLQEALRGRWDSAMTGIVILTLIALVPVLPWFWNLFFWPLWGFATGSGYPGGGLEYGWSLLPTWLSAVLSWLLALAIVGGIVFLAVRASRRGNAPRADSDPRRASADLAAPGTAEVPPSGGGASAAFSADGAESETAWVASNDPGPQAGGGEGDAEGPDATSDVAAASVSLDPPPRDATVLLSPDTADAALEPPAPAGPATDGEIAAWRTQHESWQQQNAAWRRAQQDAGRAARDQARREREAAGAVFAAEAEERRRVRRLTAPRTSGAYVWFVLGAALVVGAATALWGSAEAGEGYATALGLLTAALIVGLAMVVAGVVRRRSGFLASVSVLLLLGAGTATAVPALQGVHVGSHTLNSYSSFDEPFVQLWGTTQLSVLDLGKSLPPIVIEQRDGYIGITLSVGVELDLSALTGSGQVMVVDVDRRTGEYTERAFEHDRRLVDGRYLIEAVIAAEGAEITTRQRVEIDQGAGSITVYVTTTGDRSPST